MSEQRRIAYESYRKRAEIPRGLDYLADLLVRAVIRGQPKNVRQFAAEFFDGLLKQRDQTSKPGPVAPPPEREFVPPTFETVVVTRQPKTQRPAGGGEASEVEEGGDVATKRDDDDFDEDDRSIHYVEATAVRTLAANTGSVAILGTTAKCRSLVGGGDDDSPTRFPPDRQSTWPSSSSSGDPTPPANVQLAQVETRYVEATAVRTLAAETGSIAILGTTADPKPRQANTATDEESGSVHYVEATAVRHLAAETGTIAIPPPPAQPGADSASIGQELSWPPPPLESEEERTIAPGFSFDLPDPPTDMDQMDSETDRMDISDEEMRATTGLPSDEEDKTETETTKGGGDAMKPTAATVARDGAAAAEPANAHSADDRAATTIQAVYRGFRARKYVETVHAAAAKIQAGFRGYRVRQSLKNHAAPPSTTDDSQCWSEDDDQKSVVSVAHRPPPPPAADAAECGRDEGAGTLPVPAADAVLTSAAVKIQARVRGFAARKRLNGDRNGKLQ